MAVMPRVEQPKIEIERITMAVMPRVEQPKIEIERKIGNTTYIVNGFFASQGITVSKRIIRVLDKETKK